MLQIVVAGGGIGGLAAALAASRAGCHVRLLERAAQFSEIGAGIQLGPNVVKVLQHWGLLDGVMRLAAVPSRLQVISAETGQPLAGLRLGDVVARRYGAPYLTMHRADLHSVLLQAVQQTGDTVLHAARPLLSFMQTAHAVTVRTSIEPDIECDALIGADGLWSAVRSQLLGDGPPRRTGHLAYRALVRQTDLPEHLRSQIVTVWLGPRMHVVQYPVKAGEYLNVVAFVHDDANSATAQSTPGDASGEWSQRASTAGLLAAVGKTACIQLRDFIESINSWALWVMYDRPPMAGAHQHALGNVALLGDAAHPMRPYLAQGAGMAIEDAAELGHVLHQAANTGIEVATVLQRYALNRWQRNARVQQRALRNGQIFHADGVVRWGRDTSLKLLGEKLLDMPWLYGAVVKVI